MASHEARREQRRVLWGDATPASGNELPKGIEVQMLKLQWPALHPLKDGQPNHPGYVSGELFSENNLEIIPENPRVETQRVI